MNSNSTKQAVVIVPISMNKWRWSGPFSQMLRCRSMVREEEGGMGGVVCSGAVRKSSSPYTKTQYVLGSMCWVGVQHLLV